MVGGVFFSTGTSTLTVSTGVTTPGGIYTFMVTGVDISGRGPTNGAQSLTLNTERISSYSLTASPPLPYPVNAGQTATSMVGVNPSLGYTGTVTLICSVKGNNLPLPRCQFDPNPVNVRPDAAAVSKLTVSTFNSTHGPVPVDVVGVDTNGVGPNNGSPRTISLFVQVQNALPPSLCTDPTAALAPPGNFVATMTPSNTMMGQVKLTWAPVPGADAYTIYTDRFGLPPITNPDDPGTISLVSFAPTPPFAIQPGTASGAVISDLPLFYPVSFAIASVKYVGGSGGATANCEGQQARSNPPSVTPVAAPQARVWGFADTHTHQFAERAFDQAFIIGKAFGDPAHAFDGDYVGHGTELKMPSHKTGGFPNFDGWPTWNIQTHQQMYSDWLFRAYLGGLRLMVMHGTSNETLCLVLVGPPRNITGQYDCSDMHAVDRQLSGAREMENYLNSQCPQAAPPRCPQQNMGWYHVVTSAGEARATINRGQLAVVLGIEVDRLFDCALTPWGDPRTGGRQCSPDDVSAALRTYFDKGVRHIFPAHLADTAFAGMALYRGPISWNYNNHFLNGTWINAGKVACSDPHISFNFNDDTTGNALAILTGLGNQGNPPTYDAVDCNNTGLTTLGRNLIWQMMGLHMIIDIDHMSMRSISDTFAWTGVQGYPVIAGHTGFLGVANSSDKQNEAWKTDSQLFYIKRFGGLAAAGLNVGTTQDVKQFSWPHGSQIANDCSNSTKTWAQSYLYAVDHLGGPLGAAVAVATDQPMNEFIGPRFNGSQGLISGEPGCGGNHSEEAIQESSSPRVNYPVAVLDSSHRVSLSRLQTYNRTWDFNTDGMAHIGMYPDMIQDLVQLGLSEQDLQPLFRSAEQYIEMWEKAERTQCTVCQ